MHTLCPEGAATAFEPPSGNSANTLPRGRDMNLSEAIEHANALFLPGFDDDESLNAARRKNEEAIGLLMTAWLAAKKGEEEYSFDLVRQLADRNRSVCDLYGADRLRNENGSNLARSLSEDDLVRGVAKLQRRRPQTVRKTAGFGAQDLGIAFTEAPVRGTVLGVDIETTSRDPDRGYIVNIGLAVMELTADAVPHDGHSAYFGIPDMYAETGVPLADIHHISWQDVEGKTPFRQDRRAQKAILSAFKAMPVMAHNAAFEDSWFLLHLDGYAEARKSGKICLVDTRDICRRIDPEVRTLPRESAPASLENWARRRKTLREDEKERHLGLDDVFLMLQTVQAEFALRNMLA